MKAPAQNPQAQTPQNPAGKTSSNSPSNAAGKAHSSKHSRSKSKSGSRHARERAQRAPTPERISEVQSALARSGHYSGQPTGKWDASTVQAMKKYQAANGLASTGKLDAHTLQKLGLGSPIAGVAAPRALAPTAPAANPSSPGRSVAPPAPKTPPATPR